jgi:arylsulfatase A-like enzyme
VDADTLGTRLQEVGVSTALFGKYLNEYELHLAPYVPPGWDRWEALGTGDNAYDQQVVIGSSGLTASTGTVTGTDGEHITPFLFEEALDFVDQHVDDPFFVYLAPMSPHLSGQPMTEDRTLYEDYSPRGDAWNEADVSDKPAWIQAIPSFSDEDIAQVDGEARQMVKNLTSLDREMGVLLDGLEERGLLENTIVVYVSDNGYLFGEHRLHGKGLPYEESVRVPMYVRMPGMAGRTDTRLLEINTDLAATLLDFFGAAPTGEGESFADTIAEPTVPLRDHIFIDSYSPDSPMWTGVVTPEYKYVEWGSGETEIYDLTADPAEMSSLSPAEVPAATLDTWRSWVDEHRALAITTTTLPPAQVGVPYAAQLEHWGGTEPVIFSADAGTLPAGVYLDRSGAVTGTPTEAGEFLVTFSATGAATSPANARAEQFWQSISLTVGAAAVAPEAFREEEGAARVRVHTRPGVTVRVEATLDPFREGRRVVSDTVIAGRSGEAVVHLSGLDDDRAWYWVAYLDGVAGPHGRIGDR